MATRTFTTAGVNNLWSNAANWDTGVPVNTDTAVIPLGQDCEFDVDQSAFANGVTVTLNGTLHASTTAGSYVLKLQANMTGSGTLRAGTSGTPYPTNCTFEIVRGGFEITATSMTLDLNCSEPTTKYVRLSGVEAAGQTILSVDTDVTGEAAYWADGAIVRICDVNNGNDNEERIIAVGGVAATTITITAGLTAQKETGAYIILVSRNVKITHTAASGNAINGNLGNLPGNISAEIRNANVGISYRSLATIGGTISGCNIGLSTDVNSCTVSALICGCTNGVLGGAASIFSSIVAGCSSAGLNSVQGSILTSTGIIVGCSSGVYGCSAMIIYGQIFGNTFGVRLGGGHKLISAVLSNTQDLANVSDCALYNTQLNGTSEFPGYSGSFSSVANFVESIDHDAVAGAYKAFTRGGIVTSDVITVYPGRTKSYKHACESASFYVFRNYSVTVDAGRAVIVQCYVQKDAAMAYLPRLWILLPGVEPFISGSPDYEAIMTNSINTWETLTLGYTNSGASPVTVTIRTLAKDAGPTNAYFDPIITILSDATDSSVLPFVFGGEWKLSQQNRIAFYLQDVTGTGVTGLGNGFTLQVSKNGGAFVAGVGIKAEIGNGWYTYLATAAEADSVGMVAIRVTNAGVIPQNLEYIIEQRNPGAIQFTYTVTNILTGIPIEGVECWFATNAGFSNIVWAGHTDAFGIARDDNGGLPLLDAGTYHIRCQKSGFTFTDDSEVVS